MNETGISTSGSPPTATGATSDPGALGAGPADAGESSALEEMRCIRARYARGTASEIDLQRYRALWVALSLRRSPQCREELRSDVLAALARFRRAREALEQERARVAIESVFGPEDGAPMEDLAQPH
jgi:hypothetical protein